MQIWYRPKGSKGGPCISDRWDHTRTSLDVWYRSDPDGKTLYRNDKNTAWRPSKEFPDNMTPTMFLCYGMLPVDKDGDRVGPLSVDIGL